jgi:hypothetical protein
MMEQAPLHVVVSNRPVLTKPDARLRKAAVLPSIGRKAVQLAERNPMAAVMLEELLDALPEKGGANV